MGEIGPSEDFADVGPCIPEGMSRGSQELGSSGLGAHEKEYTRPTDIGGQEGSRVSLIRHEVRERFNFINPGGLKINGRGKPEC